MNTENKALCVKFLDVRTIRSSSIWLTENFINCKTFIINFYNILWLPSIIVESKSHKIMYYEKNWRNYWGFEVVKQDFKTFIFILWNWHHRKRYIRPVAQYMNLCRLSMPCSCCNCTSRHCSTVVHGLSFEQRAIRLLRFLNLHMNTVPYKVKKQRIDLGWGYPGLTFTLFERDTFKIL